HDRHRTRRVGRRDIEHLFALAGIGEAFVLGNDEAAALRACEEKLTPALVAENSHDVSLLLEVDEKTDRLAMPAATPQLRRIEGIESPLLANTRHLDVVSAGNANFGPSSALKAMLDRSPTVPRSARIQPFSDTTTVIGSRSTSASSIAASSCSGASAQEVRRLPSAVLGENFVRTALISSATFFHCSFSEPMRSLSDLRSARSSLSSLLISISSSLRRLRSRMLRMASACTSESLNVFIKTGLGSSSLRMILMTLSRLR